MIHIWNIQFLNDIENNEVSYLFNTKLQFMVCTHNWPTVACTYFQKKFWIFSLHFGRISTYAAVAQEEEQSPINRKVVRLRLPRATCRSVLGQDTEPHVAYRCIIGVWMYVWMVEST